MNSSFSRRGSRLLGLLACALITLPSPAFARFAAPEDLPAVNELERAQIDVDRQGHSRMVIERHIRVNNDEGREKESTQTIVFNDRASKLKILVAQTLNGEKTQDVAPNNIEIKPVSDFSRFFDTQKKAKINFPNVQIGSRIFLKYELQVNEVPNEGFFSFLANFTNTYLEHYEARIRSELPLFDWKNDPDGIFESKSSRQGRFYLFELKTKAPARYASVREDSYFIRSERVAAFGVSSLDKWSDYAKPTIDFQEKLLKQALPASMAKIRDQAQTEKTPLAKLNRVAALIGQEYRYFGDWRRRNGGFVPRPLSEIEETRYGDCKDLSLVAVAIYRALGFKADLAWTIRGDLSSRVPKIWYSVPVDWFNHAVARVETAPGEVHWIDATNSVSYAAAPPQDISGRNAFVLRANGAWMDEIPELDASGSVSEKNLRYEYQPADAVMKVTGEMKLKGRAAIAMTQRAFYEPVETVNYGIVKSLSYGSRSRNSFVGDFPRGTRVVGDLEIPFGFTLTDAGVRTSAGLGFVLLREGVVDRLLEETKERVSDLYLEAPGLWITTEEVVGLKKVGQNSLDCDLSNEWIHASRHVRETKTGVIAENRFEVRQPIVPNEALQKPEFEKFQQDLRECFYKASLILAKSK